jgi:hypothetical protein
VQQCLLAVHMVEGAPARSDEETQLACARTDRVNNELQAAGAWVFGGGCGSRAARPRPMR